MNRRRLMAICLGAAVIGALAAGCSRQQQISPQVGLRPPPPEPAVQKTTTIRQIGSTTVLPLAEKWREALNRKYPNIQIAVSGGGSGTGIKALLAGSAEIANASRPVKDKERTQAQAAGIELVEHLVAYDGLAVIVHPSNPLGELSIEQLSDIFTGNVNNWSEVDGPGQEIVLINRDSASGSYEVFRDVVVMLHKTDKQRDYAPDAIAQTSNQGVLALVSQTERAIGYVGLGYLDESVKALEIIPMGGGDAVEPLVENVQDKSYPLSRSLLMYTNAEPTGELAKYFEYIKSPEGQAIVAELGYVPVPE